MELTDVKINGCGYEAEFSSRLGATCYRLTYEPLGCDVLRTPTSEADLKINPYLYGNPILFPCNRISGGKFTFDGREYRFPINEPKTNCHIHGALYSLPFKVIYLAADKATFRYEAAKGEYLGFPHAFAVEREYTANKRGLTEKTTFVNLSSEKMPLTLAFHTTFNAPFSGKCKCYATVPAVSEQLRNENFLPTGEWSSGEREERMRRGEYEVGKIHLSALYKIDKPDCFLATDGAILKYSASPEYGYRMTYAESGGGFMVIEPQTSAIDCFHLPEPPEKHGLIAINPGKSVTFSSSISVRKKEVLRAD